MEHVIELLKIILPAGAVFIAVYFIVQRFLDNDQKRREHELRKTSQSLVTPLKLQAYERVVLFLERIHPNTMVVRVNKHGMNAQQLQQELIKSIRSEFEHNLSQQIYVSHGAWELVKTAKEELIKLINMSANKVPNDANSTDLAMMVLNIAANLDKKLPNEVAIDYIKKEVAQTF